jgi:SP family arabinose:H+ symporter-like MFS transporter
MKSAIDQNNQQKKGFLYLVCFIAALGGFLFGFDTAVISGTVGLVKNDFRLDALQEGWFVSCALLGCIIGVAFSGKLSDKYGRKIVLILSALLFLVSAVGCIICSSFSQLVIFRLIGGLGIGVASMVSPLYISEFSPAKFRGMMVSLYQLALTVGIVVAYFSNAYIENLHNAIWNNADLRQIFVTEPWRAMLGLGIFPSGIFLISLFLVPESPRWLLLRNQTDKARAILIKIDGVEKAEDEIGGFIVMDKSGSVSNVNELFKPVYRKALYIGLLLPFLSQVCGINAVIYYGPKILEGAGFTLSNALGGQVTIGIVNVVFTFVAIFTVDKWGRRPLLYTGIIGAVVSLVCIGTLFTLGVTHGPAILIFILVFIACFAFSFGPVCWVVVGEIFPNGIRGKAMSLATLSLWVGNFLVGQLTPLSLEGLGPAATFFLFALFCSPAIWVTWKLIPETKGRSLENIDEYWKESLDKEVEKQPTTRKIKVYNNL